MTHRRLTEKRACSVEFEESDSWTFGCSVLCLAGENKIFAHQNMEEPLRVDAVWLAGQSEDYDSFDSEPRNRLGTS